MTAALDAARPAPTYPAGSVPRGRGPRIIAVTSGKGGVGKTSIVANLGLELSRRGASTVLVEGDPHLPDLSFLLNLTAPGGRTPSVEADREVRPKLRLIPAHASAAALARLARAKAEGSADGGADFVLIDTSAGIAPPVLELVALAERALVVTTHEPPTLAAAYELVRAAHGHGATRLDVVVNMATSHLAARESHAQLSGLTERNLGLRPTLAAVVPRDEAVRAAVMRREPMTLIFPYARATRAVAALARTLIDIEGRHHERSRVSLAVRDRW